MSSSLTDLRCEYLSTPLGLDEPTPRLSWRLDTSDLGAKQIAYRVTVGLAANATDLWDTGWVESEATPTVEYAGKPLPAKSRVFWTVTVREQGGNELSASSWWETGIGEWTAEWIQGPLVGGERTTAPAAYLSRKFRIDKPVTQARLYVTALGLYEIELNGKRVGDHHLAPGWTDTNKRLRYQTYDVTAMLGKENEILAILGDGWYCGHIGWRNRQFYGDRPKLLAELQVRHPDGSVTCLITDANWSAGQGPILENDLLMGESVDARQPITSDWQAQVVTAHLGKVRASACPPIRKLREIPAVSVKRLGAWPSDRYIFDFGQNMVGHVRLRVDAEPGQHFTLRHGEVLDKNEKLYTENLRSARCTDQYTAKGGSEEIWEPKFTFHGFRYLEVTGFTKEPDLAAATGIVAYSDLPQIGTFECSDPLLTQLQHNILWGWRGNSLDVPTDCPQRDERLGWTGDAQMFAATACFNTFAAGFFEKFVQDLDDAQGIHGAIPPVAPDVKLDLSDGGPAWADAFVIIPWQIWQAYGDRRIIERHYPAMKEWHAQQTATSRDGVRCYEGYEGFRGFGDWVAVGSETPKELLGTAFFVYSSWIMIQIASELGKEADTSHFQAILTTAKEAFQREFLASGVELSQTAIALAIHFNIALESQREELLARLVADIEGRDGRLSTGFIGAPYLLHVLSRCGKWDLAYRLLEQKKWPSWLYPVTQGATTIWERWDGWTEENGFQDPGMNSFNHYAYGSVGEWIYGNVLGIALAKIDPYTHVPATWLGGKRFRLAPHPGGSLTSASGSLETVFGRIDMAWEKSNGRTAFKMTVPPNTEAEFIFPPDATDLKDGNGGAADKNVPLLPGSYTFSAKSN